MQDVKLFVNDEELSLTNCCPHDVYIQDDDGAVYKLPEEAANVIRVENISTHKKVRNFTIKVIEAQIVAELPPYIENHYYIVSNPVAQVLWKHDIYRKDFVALGKKLGGKDYIGDPMAAKVRVGFVCYNV